MRNLVEEREPERNLVEEAAAERNLVEDADSALEQLEEIVPFDAGVPLFAEEASNFKAFLNSIISPEVRKGFKEDFGAMLLAPAMVYGTPPELITSSVKDKAVDDFLLYADAEEVLRRSGINLTAVLQETKVGKGVRYFSRLPESIVLRDKTGLSAIRGEETRPLSWADIKQALSDGFNGKQYVGTADMFRRVSSTKEEMKGYYEFLERHDNVRRIMTAHDIATEFSFAIVTDALLARGAASAAKGVKGFFKGTKLGKRAFADLVGERMMALKYLDEASERWNLRTALDDKLKRDQWLRDMTIGEQQAELQKPFHDPGTPYATYRKVDPLQRAIDEGNPYIFPDAPKFGQDVVKSFNPYLTAEVVKRELQTEYIGQLLTDGVVKKNTIDELAQVVTFKRTRNIAELTDDELASVVDMVDEIRLAPQRFKTGPMSRLARNTTGPPVHIFRRLGLQETYMKLQEGMYNVRNANIGRRLWKSDMKKRYRRAFGKSWNDTANEITARIANNVELPDDLVKDVTPRELEFIANAVADDKNLHWDFTADIAEARGWISSDPAKIAAGVPERKAQYFHWMHEKVIEGIQDRQRIAQETGATIIVPPDYYLEKALRGKPPAKINVGEFIARRGTPDDISYDWDTVSDIAWNEELRKIFQEPAFEGAVVTAKGLQGANRGAALRYLAEWMRDARGMPAPSVEKLNRVFSKRYDEGVRNFDKFATVMTKTGRAGTMLGNLRPPGKNLFQGGIGGLTSNLIGHKSSAWGLKSLLTEDGRRLFRTSDVIKGRMTPLAEISRLDFGGKFNRVQYLPMGLVDRYWNCVTAYNGGIYDIVTKDPKIWKELVDFAARRKVTERALRNVKFAGVLADAIESGHPTFMRVKQMADYLVLPYSQWAYEHWNMPRHLRSQAGKMAWMYTHWGTYFGGAHMPQLVDQLLTGKDVLGRKATPEVRYALFMFLAKGAALVYAGKKLGYDMKFFTPVGTMPRGRILGKEVTIPISPPISMLVSGAAAMAGLANGLVNALGEASWGAITDNNKLLDSGLRSFRYSLPAMIPGGVAFKRYQRIFKGEEPIGSILYRPTRKKPKGGLNYLKGLEELESADIMETGVQLPKR